MSKNKVDEQKDNLMQFSVGELSDEVIRLSKIIDRYRQDMITSRGLIRTLKHEKKQQEVVILQQSNSIKSMSNKLYNNKGNSEKALETVNSFFNRKIFKNVLFPLMLVSLVGFVINMFI